MRCSKCGKEIADDSLFCEFCGTRVKKGVNKLIWIVLASVITLGIILVVVLSNTGKTNDKEVTDNSSAIELHSDGNAEMERLQNIVDSLMIENGKLEERNKSLQKQKESLERQNASLSAKVQRFNEVLNN